MQELRGKADAWAVERRRLEAANAELQRSSMLCAPQKGELARRGDQGRRALASRWAGGALASRWAGGAGEQVGWAGAVDRPGLPPTRGMLSCPLSGPQRPRHWGPLLQQPCLMEWGRVLNETVRVKGSPRLGRHTDTQTPTRFPAG